MLCRYIRALCPQQKFDEYTPDAWADVLSGYQLDDARRAAAAVARRQPFVSPSEIIAEIRRTRAAASGVPDGPGLSGPPPDADPDDARGYLAALRSGRTRTPRAELTAHPTDKLVAGYSVTDERPERPRTGNPLTVRCPTCTAPIGRHCRTGTTRRAPHRARRDAARAAAGHPVEPRDTPEDIEARRAASARYLANHPHTEETA